MLQRRFLIRASAKADQHALDRPDHVAIRDATDIGLTVKTIHDLSLAMGEPCWALEVEGEADKLEELTQTWQLHWLRVDDADEEVRELDEP